MVVLDTNVLSELMRAEPDPRVARWVASQSTTSLFTTSLNYAEVFYGLALMPEGRRRTDLIVAARSMFDDDLYGRILSFDTSAALSYAEITASRRRIGRPIELIDAQIAAIARSRGAELATRHTRDFAECGVTIIDPWA